MDQKKRLQVFMIGILSIGCIAFVTVSILEKWEYWVNPLVILGLLAIWGMHIFGYADENTREIFYLLYAMLLSFFHGIHASSFMDLAVVSVLVIITFSMMNRLHYLHILLGEFLFLMILQINHGLKDGWLEVSALQLERILLHVMVVVGVYLVCRKIIIGNLEREKLLQTREMEREDNVREMEDFLTNISHELRTPVNVVNGMTTLILKEQDNPDVVSIQEAGIRLSRQIEDIQDYTEIIRGDLSLEEDRYAIISVINDVLTTFRLQKKDSRLEFVVDLDPSVPTMMQGDIKKLHKILRHLMDNAIKYTRRGGIYVRIYTIPRDYGVNLLMEVSDTGIGMSKKDVVNASKGFYQANKKRNRSTGGIGLGLSIVYGFVHCMGGFAKIESKLGSGTTVTISVPQKVLDPQPCLGLNSDLAGNIIFHTRAGKYIVPEVREFYRQMAIHMASGLKLNLYSAGTVQEMEDIMDKLEVSHIFMGEEEYLENPSYMDQLAELGIVVAVSASAEFEPAAGSKVIKMPKPLYGYPVTRILNEGALAGSLTGEEENPKPVLDGVKALIVDDEPMNLVVASGLFRGYGMEIDTADSGMEAIEKSNLEKYDLIFMDHMMPEMDGVEAMKRIKNFWKQHGENIPVIALTANAVSGAREMFLREGFDGFISKPIDIPEFERVIKNVLPNVQVQKTGGKA